MLHRPAWGLILRRKPWFWLFQFGPFFRDHNLVVIAQNLALCAGVITVPMSLLGRADEVMNKEDQCPWRECALQRVGGRLRSSARIRSTINASTKVILWLLLISGFSVVRPPVMSALGP
jgi:hypothetical protein